MLFGINRDGDIGDDGGSGGDSEYGNDNVITDCLESLPTAEELVSLSDGLYVTEYYKLPVEGELASFSVGDFGVGSNDGGWGGVTEYYNYQQRGSWPLSQLRSRR